jgi:4-hydroxy-3-polyprenylbenzoate decarboxylase
MFTCWSDVSLIKQVTVVDSTIDPWDMNAVERARITHCRADRDIVVVPGVSADRSEPQEVDGLVAKVGYDATARDQDRREGSRAANPPDSVLAHVQQLLSSGPSLN